MRGRDQALTRKSGLRRNVETELEFLLKENVRAIEPGVEGKTLRRKEFDAETSGRWGGKDELI